MPSLKTLRGKIADELLSKQTKADMDAFLEDILTPAEVETIEERLRIARALASGKTQREVAEKEKASITTVSRAAKMLKYGRVKKGWLS